MNCDGLYKLNTTICYKKEHSPENKFFSKTSTLEHLINKLLTIQSFAQLLEIKYSQLHARKQIDLMYMGIKENKGRKEDEKTEPC